MFRTSRCGVVLIGEASARVADKPRKRKTQAKNRCSILEQVSEAVEDFKGFDYFEGLNEWMREKRDSNTARITSKR